MEEVQAPLSAPSSCDADAGLTLPISQDEVDYPKKYARVIQVAREAAGTGVSTAAPLYEKHPLLRCLVLYIIFLLYTLFFWVGSRELVQRMMFDLDARAVKVQIIIQKTASQSLAPWPIPTGMCTIRIINTCANRIECTRSRLIGYGITSNQQIRLNQENILHQFSVAPVMMWPGLPETFQNRKLCDVTLVLDQNMSIEIIAENVAVFVENSTLRSIVIENTAIGELWLQAKDITVSHELKIQGVKAGILVEDLNMPSNASATIAIREGVVDLTTTTAPSFSITSSNQAVCLVGSLPSSPAEAAIAADGNASATLYVGAFACPDDISCSQPRWNISTLGPRSSIGVHAAGQLARPGRVYSGAAFRDGSFAAMEPGLAAGNAADWAYVGLKGLGLMRGGLQLVWSRRRIWFFWESDVTYFAWLSVFVVMPKIAELSATVSFCPAHGPGVEKHLIPPLLRVMDTAGGEGNWIYRNFGGLRDSMVPLDVAAGLNYLGALSYDRYIPDCAYCAHMSLWRSAYYVGAFGGRTGECEGFPDPAACRTFACHKQSAHMFALVPRGAAACYPGAAVEALASNEGVRFDAAAGWCWASADVRCAALPSGGEVDSVYANAQATAMVGVSWAIGGVVALYCLRTVHALVVRSARCELIMGHILAEPHALALVHEAVLLSRSFAAVREPPPPTPPDPPPPPAAAGAAAGEGERLIEREEASAVVLDFVALDRMDAGRGLRARVRGWLLPRRGPAWEEPEAGSGLTAVRARDLASRR